ncbi:MULTISPECIES: branched-chain amino acid ABC transporter permease [unclassified Chelatococcus]|uniref:branched-chain amino acid ABC transporter permease n=1 Tax=unclassified Chelatococcus TaxID=2638111 RepID=UPI001BCE411B|nr:MULTISPECIES: branched-chain amino acid ABC transporter permease [unclassified Chelatococcus]MBS7700336.1 branched-chain amino acid ABC transporter permease [Chelatococcus sp. YT9]MBX3556132.1 branched-chain amino acid ABC transporter permease [Chelatococcus sp.]
MTVLFNDYYLNILVMTCLWAALSGAWNLMAGYGGLVSLGQSAFFGIGAYVTAIVYTKYGISPWFGLIAGMIVTTGLAVAISWPCFRLRGAFFSLATLVFPIAMEIVANNWSDMTRGPSGIAIPFRPGLDTFIFSSRSAYLIAAFILMMIVYGITRWMHRGKLGLYLIAVRDDEATAQSMGINTVKVKLIVTIMSAALTAVGGFFYAQYILFLDPPSVFSINISVQIALLSIIGGLGTPLGPIVGSLVMTPLDGVLSQFFGGGVRLLIYGIALLAAVLLAPKGIVGTVKAWRRP